MPSTVPGTATPRVPAKSSQAPARARWRTASQAMSRPKRPAIGVANDGDVDLFQARREDPGLDPGLGEEALAHADHLRALPVHHGEEALLRGGERPRAPLHQQVDGALDHAERGAQLVAERRHLLGPALHQLTEPVQLGLLGGCHPAQARDGEPGAAGESRDGRHRRPRTGHRDGGADRAREADQQGQPRRPASEAV